MLTFLIPVRHPDSVPDWRLVRGLIATTLRSVAAQAGGEWAAYVAVERTADLGEPPPGVRIVRTDIPDPRLPDLRSQNAARAAAVRRDKGARLVAALEAARGDCAAGGHLMVCDYDDLVSRRLAAFARGKADGWVVERGMLWDGGRWALLHPGPFHELCGTSVIVHSRHLTGADGPLGSGERADRHLGSHKFLVDDLAAQGTPLAPVPFAGAVYRLGTGVNAMQSNDLWRRIANPRLLRRHPLRQLRSALALRRVGPAFRREFMAA